MPLPQMFERIILPLDGTQLSERAVPLAIATAGQSGAELILLSVVTEGAATTDAIEIAPEHPQYEDMDEEVHNRAEYLLSLAGRLENRVGKLRVMIARGNATDRIIKTSEQQNADLVVMTTHGRVGVARGVLGSVTDETILKSSVPVLTIRGDYAPTSRDLQIESIHVALDGSELADSSLRYAAMLARAFSARIGLVRVLGKSEADFAHVEAQRHLDRVKAALEVDDLDVVTMVLIGEPIDELLVVAKGAPGSVMALTTRGSSGLIRQLRGSVAETLLRESTTPILVLSPAAVERLGPSIY